VAVSDDLPVTRDTARPALRPTVAPARAGGGSVPPLRWGRRLLGGALLVATLGLGSCHAFWVALLA